MNSSISFIIQAQKSADLMRKLIDKLNATGKLRCEYPPDSFYWAGDYKELQALLDEHKKENDL